jgi:hypothetical protein
MRSGPHRARDVYNDMRMNLTPSHRRLSVGIIKLFQPGNEAPVERLMETALESIDTYLTQGNENAVHEEPAFRNSFNFDLNAFLKWEQLGKNEESTPRYRDMLGVTRMVMGTRVGGQTSCRDMVKSVIERQ